MEKQTLSVLFYRYNLWGLHVCFGTTDRREFQHINTEWTAISWRQ